MFATDTKTDLISIFAEFKRSTRPIDLSSDANLDNVGLDPSALIEELGLPQQANSITLQELVAVVEKPENSVARSNLWRLASEARLRRIFRACASLAGDEIKLIDEDNALWFGLAYQVIGWFAEEAKNKAADSSPELLVGKLISELTSLGLLTQQELMNTAEMDGSLFLMVLERNGFPREIAAQCQGSLIALTKGLSREFGSSVQNFLRDAAEEFATKVVKQTTDLTRQNLIIKPAVHMWLRSSMGLPIEAWSPLTSLVLKKLNLVSADNSIAEKLAGRYGYINVDQILVRFAQNLCQGCNPDNSDHQRCVKLFRAKGWLLECPRRPDLSVRFH